MIKIKKRMCKTRCPEDRDKGPLLHRASCDATTRRPTDRPLEEGSARGQAQRCMPRANPKEDLTQLAPERA